jgi:DNA modification methylase
MELYRTIHGSAHDIPLPDNSVQCIVTSPPYWGLRKYAGEQCVEWPAVTFRFNEWVPETTVDAMTCDLGLEPSPVAYIAHLILCMREWHRVLRDDGVVFVNLGDSYAGSSTGGFRPGAGRADGIVDDRNQRNRNGNICPDGLKPKDLCGIPEMFRLAARADGWWWRSLIAWIKTNPMPESVTDRPTSAWEPVMLFAKSQRYFWDSEAVREENAGILPYGDKHNFGMNDEYAQGKHGSTSMFAGGSKEEYIAKYYTNGRNLRNWWMIPTQPFSGSHFACYPEKLVEPCIKAGSAVGDTVLDPFHGSGTTGIVALRLGRAYVGVDISAEYLDGVTAQRLEKRGAQIGMGLW